MAKFILFLRRISFLLLFIILEILAFNFYAKSTNYTRAKLLTLSNSVVGGAHQTISSVDDYFALRSENTLLTQEIARLNNELGAYKENQTIDHNNVVPQELSRYVYMPARVINNSIARQKNYFTLNKGARDGVQEGMAVISASGVAVGYVLSSSDRMSVCISVLNTSFRTSGKIKRGDYFGSIFWDGVSEEYITMEEISKYAKIEKGDTIVTTNYSAIFPEDMILGTIEDSRLSDNSAYYIVKVRLGTHISALNHVFVVNYRNAQEQLLLQQEVAQATKPAVRVLPSTGD